MASTTARAAGERVARSCPSVHVPFFEVDGALVRVRLPGGMLAAGAARVVAAAAGAAGAGPIELTNRANLQIRGIPPDAVGDVRDALVSAHVTPADPDADERRNVLASPTAGFDRTELVDTTVFVRAVADRLAASAAGLSPKFGVLVDGGGEVHLRGRAHDLVLGALRTDDRGVGFEVGLATPLPLRRPDDSVAWQVDVSHVLDVVDAVIAACAPVGRAADLMNAYGSDRVWNDLRRRTGGALRPIEAARCRAPAVASIPAVGVRPQIDPNRSWIGVAPVLGRMSPTVVGALASLAEEHGSGDLRVTPWRSVVIPGVATGNTGEVTAACERHGLVVDPSHPANTVVACAGRTGCPAGLTDTQTDARAVVDRLTRIPESERPGSVHVSGCEKGCARPRPAAVSLVAGPAPGAYGVYRDDPGAEDTTRFGRRVASGLDRDQAVERVGTPEDHMTVGTYERDSDEIYRRSFAIIRAEADLTRVPPDLEAAAVRMVHACGMVDLVDDLDWSPGVGAAVRASLRGGAPILTDSTMLARGITRRRLPADNAVRCIVAEPDVAARAAAAGTTRSAAAMDAWGDRLAGAVVAIGNAPTALFRLLEVIDARGPRPAAVVGVPVGFVGAVESKRALARGVHGVPWLTVHGRRGGSAIAAAAVNALACEAE